MRFFPRRYLERESGRVTARRAVVLQERARCHRLPAESIGEILTLVPVAAILVASLRLHCLDTLLHLRYRGPRSLDCDYELRRGQELGWFEHGSTIILFAPPGYVLCPGVTETQRVRMGQALLHRPE